MVLDSLWIPWWLGRVCPILMLRPLLFFKGGVTTPRACRSIVVIQNEVRGILMEEEKWHEHHRHVARAAIIWNWDSFVGGRGRGRGEESHDEEQENETTHSSSWSPWSRFLSPLHPLLPVMCRGLLEDKKPPINNWFTDGGGEQWRSIEQLGGRFTITVSFFRQEKSIWCLKSRRSYR